MSTSDSFTPEVWSRDQAMQRAFEMTLRWRFFPEPEYLPVPWYGRIRQRLAQVLYGASHWLDQRQREVYALAFHADYHARVKPGEPLSTTITWPRYANLDLATRQD